MLSNVKPIPKRILIHSIILKKVTGTDSYNKKVFAPDVEIKKVRVEPVDQVKTSSGEEKNQINIMIFYDSVNSIPKGVVFAKEDEIVFKGKTLTVIKVDNLYAFDGETVHHYEIGCK